LSNRIVTTITIRDELKREAEEKIIKTGKIPGVNNFSALVEYAIARILSEIRGEEAGS